MALSRRPYLIRAIHEWACDDGQTPHLLVAADFPGCDVPMDYVEEGRITLNIGLRAISHLSMEGDAIVFSARFGGRPFSCRVPWGAVLAIFGRESGEGIVFGEVESTPERDDGDRPDDPSPEPDPSPRKSHLRVIK
ncbi:ClpXP protease specificity-enhancing factor [Algiphilus sp. NNCM1]|uniref:ClpXP protease specificity-enhancing factor n=1 Tax=Algiphilus sp. TaxID=1872431 RepID=UPI001CA69A22|nr:ClpXP protease specificity-enhancing factor [Algiphilus sp.]MBY8965905.1 ClpXP protease specificity-enhancing factor [Algiphilus acroporae]MCI5061635.1 ClpXP protease specificity-enhancing factor [Algiphilus sp.]MCI5102400.1 ClpXP protease specificity-enhancing factor [Algiphilus sp.]